MSEYSVINFGRFQSIFFQTVGVRAAISLSGLQFRTVPSKRGSYSAWILLTQRALQITKLTEEVPAEGTIATFFGFISETKGKSVIIVCYRIKQYCPR